MKQAILVTAYKNIEHLIDLVQFFDDGYCFFIHLDKNSNLDEKSIKELSSLSNVALVSREYKTNWAGLNHVRAMLFLMQEALKKDVEYVHLISGHDFPIKSSEQIRQFLIANKGKEFLECFTLPTSRWDGGGLNRMEYYYLYDYVNFKMRLRKLFYYLTWVQKRIGVKRGFEEGFPALFGGGTWWTLTSDCVKYAVMFVKDNPQFFNRFKLTSCPEEILLPTIIMNSSFSKNVVNDTLRYIVWEKRNGNSPANLDESDWQSIMASKQLFARRFEYPVSVGLLNRIRNQFVLHK